MARPEVDPRRQARQLDRAVIDQLLVAAGSQNLRADRRRLLGALAEIDQWNPADAALAEHLDARLTEAERGAIVLRGVRGLSRARAAAALGVGEEELAQLGAAAAAKGAELTIAFHEQTICEPAALAQAATPQQRLEAVREHLRGCSSCRAEFAARIALVLWAAAHLGDARVAAVDG